MEDYRRFIEAGGVPSEFRKFGLQRAATVRRLPHAGRHLVVVIQSDLLEAMPTRVVAPLLPAGAAGRPIAASLPRSCSARRSWC